MVDNEPHAVVRLLLKRMESHPEEFRLGNGRWAEWLDLLIPFVTEAERVLLRGPMMQEIHEQVMEELCNGPERRRKEAEEHEYERNLAASVQHMKQQQARQHLTALQQGLGIGTQPPSQPLVIQSGGKETLRIQANGDIHMGNEVLNEGLLKNIKKALKL